MEGSFLVPGLVPGYYCTLVIMSGTSGICGCQPGDTLDHLALVTAGACLSGSHGTMAIGQTVLGRLPPAGHCTDSELKHTTQSFCEAGLFECPGAVVSGAGFRLGTHLWPTEMGFQRMQTVDVILAHSLSSLL